MATDEWWRDAVTYQVYVRSFADSDGDGVGDLPGITSRLEHLVDLGVDAVWLTPFYPSPQHDAGYDVADHRDVDPAYGTLGDFESLLARAHGLGLRVIIDLVPNHTSADHRWFREALASEPGSPARRRYVFRSGKGETPPNNWQSNFGGPAWTRVPDGQWYLHLFDTSQPDLDWRNPEVGDEFESVLRFWLDRGVDGFRIDVAHGLFKADGLPDAADPDPKLLEVSESAPMWDQPEVHEVYRRWHRILASYDGDRMAVAEAWTATPEAMARYVRPDELQQAFNFHWLSAPWSAESFRTVIDETLAAVLPLGVPPTWVLSNHDVVRHPTRYGGGAIGRARARAATLTMLALPGSAYLYQGEELGLEQVHVPREAWLDPAALRTGVEGRDGCRVPLPWSGDGPPYGFGPGAGQPWLPQPDDWARATVAAERGDPGSTLAFYRRALGLRRAMFAGPADEIEMLDRGTHVLAFRRGEITVALNCGETAAALPEGEVLVASGELTGRLPPDTAVWVQR